MCITSTRTLLNCLPETQGVDKATQNTAITLIHLTIANTIM